MFFRAVIDYLFTHLSEFPNMTQQEFIDYLSADLDKHFGYEDYDKGNFYVISIKRYNR